MAVQYVPEPFRIKMVETIQMLSPEQRADKIREAIPTIPFPPLYSPSAKGLAGGATYHHIRLREGGGIIYAYAVAYSLQIRRVGLACRGILLEASSGKTHGFKPQG